MIDRRNFLVAATALITDALAPAQAAPLMPIRMGYFENYAPFSFRDTHGKMTGALVDAVELVGHAAGLTFIHQGFPWVRAQALVQSGDLDGFCTTIDNQRRAYADFCPTPLITEHFDICHRVNDRRMLNLHSVQDLRPFIQGSYRGAGYPLQSLEADYIHWYKDVDTVMRLINSGGLDIYIGGNSVNALKLKELGLTRRIQCTPAPYLPAAEFCFGLRRTYPNSAVVLAKIETAAHAARQSGALDSMLVKYR